MSDLRVFHISDTHLSAEKPLFHANYDRLAAAIRAEKPDLVIHTGDIALDGADKLADLEIGKRLLDDLGVPLLAVPGNHDVGNNGEPDRSPSQPVNHERLTRYRAVFGADRFVRDIGRWRFVGLNSALFGTDLPEEAVQEAELDRALDEADGRPVAIVLHKPFFRDAPDDDAETGYWYAPKSPRLRLTERIARSSTRLVLSGHVHQQRLRVWRSIVMAWAPAASFYVPEWFHTRLGENVCGHLDLTFTGDTVSIRTARADGVADLDLADFPDAYGPLKKPA